MSCLAIEFDLHYTLSHAVMGSMVVSTPEGMNGSLRVYKTHDHIIEHAAIALFYHGDRLLFFGGNLLSLL